MSTDHEHSLDDNTGPPIACNDTVPYAGHSYVDFIGPFNLQCQTPQDGITELSEPRTLAITPGHRMTSLNLPSMEHTYDNDVVTVANLQP